MVHTHKTHAHRLFSMNNLGKDVQLLCSENKMVSSQVCATRRFSLLSALQEKVSWANLTGRHRESRMRQCAWQVGLRRLRSLVHSVSAEVVEVKEVALLVLAEEWCAKLHHE